MKTNEIAKPRVESILEALDADNMGSWDWEQFVSMGQQCRSVRDMSQWALGKLSLGIERKWGEGSLKTYAKDIGVKPSTLNVYRWVTKQFDKWDQPANHLPYYAFQLAAGTEEPEEWIQKAADNDWSTEKLQMEIRLHKDPSFKLPEKDKKQVRCPACGHHFEIEL